MKLLTFLKASRLLFDWLLPETCPDRGPIRLLLNLFWNCAADDRSPSRSPYASVQSDFFYVLILDWVPLRPLTPDVSLLKTFGLSAGKFKIEPFFLVGLLMKPAPACIPSFLALLRPDCGRTSLGRGTFSKWDCIWVWFVDAVAVALGDKLFASSFCC